MSNLELLDRAASATTCQILNSVGDELVRTSVWLLWNPKFSAAAFSAGALSVLASNYLCPDMPMGEAPPIDDMIDGCGQMAPGGYGQFQYHLGDSNWFGPQDQAIYRNTVRINPIGPLEPSEAGGRWQVNCEVYSETDGTTKSFFFDTAAEANAVKFRIDPIVGECAYNPDDPIAPTPPEAFEPIEYVDDVTECTYEVTLQGFAQETPDGVVSPVYLVAGKTDGTRSEGGRMGGCNFAPTIYMPSYGGGGGGGGGGGIHIPVPSPLPDPGDGVPWWLPPIVGGSVSAGLNLIGQELSKLSEADYEPGEFTMVAPCDYDENGEHQYRTWSFEKASFEQRIHAHQVALMEMLQQHLNWKTPTCNSYEKVPLEGDWVTTRWESVERMDHSGMRLRKLFRYRTQSTRDLGQLVAYWQDFEWRAGEVIVWHEGAWWGTPKVWAETKEEGQRVIRFAAAEAGLDPDQAGRWRTSSSRSPRYGMSGTMKIKLIKGFPWISSREGDSWPNTLARTLDS